MAAELPSDREVLWDRFESYSGVDRWFREELCIGLGASYEANFLHDPRRNPTDDEFRSAFAEGAEWAVDRGRGRFADNPSKRAALERTVWKMFESEEQMNFTFALFCEGKIRYSPITGLSETCLIGDMEAFRFSEPEEQEQAA